MCKVRRVKTRQGGAWKLTQNCCEDLKMSARFSKLQEIDLTLEDPMGEENGASNGTDIDPGYESTPDDCVVQLNLDSDAQDPVFVPKWKFWNKPYRYKYDLAATKNRFTQSQICKKCRCKINSWRAVIITLLVFTAVVLISVVISRVVSEPSDESPTSGPQDNQFEAAIAADAPVCSELSAKILKRNGSAVDAAITALLCLGAVQPESSGLGGGGFMTIRHSNGSVYTINFREKAPSKATEYMFHSNSSLSRNGGLAVAVPGELKGMELAHTLFGRLSWKELFTPVINLCREGFNMTYHSERAVFDKWNTSVSKNPILRSTYSNGDGTPKKAGDWIVRPILATTLEIIANKGADVFYKESIAESIVRAVNNSEVGGILTMDDLANYDALLQEPLHTHYKGHTVYAPPSPAGGPLLLFIMNVMGAYNISASSLNEELSQLNLTYHRLVEVFKYGFALRTRLGDPSCSSCSDNAAEILSLQYNMTTEEYGTQVMSSISDEHTFNVSHYHAQYSGLQDSGTTHLNVLASDGQAVAVTSSVNGYFGSGVVTDTGIVLNNEMDDFSSPNITNEYGFKPSPANFIRPGKRPLSSTCPTIFVTESSEGTRQSFPRLIIGASGGSIIPTAVVQSALRYLSLPESLSEAIEARRIHHQLVPNEVCPESGFPTGITEFLANRGHLIHCQNSDYAAVQGVGVSHLGNVTAAHSDSRKQRLSSRID